MPTILQNLASSLDKIVLELLGTVYTVFKSCTKAPKTFNTTSAGFIISHHRFWLFFYSQLKGHTDFVMLSSQQTKSY